MDFDKINNLFEKNDPIDPTDNYNDIFIINRFLSFYKRSFFEADEASKYIGKIPNWIIMALLYSTVERENPAPRMKYTKKAKEKISKELIEEVCSGFECNENHAKEIIEILKASGKNPKQIFGVK